KQKGFSYYFTLLLSVPCMMTNLLNHAAIRYTYYIQPFLIISASFVSLFLLSHITSATNSISLVTGMVLNRVVVGIAFIMITLWSSTFVKLYRMNNFPYPSGFSVRAESYYSDYRLSAYYLGTYYHDSDLVVSVMPEVLNYYTNIRSHHFIEPYVMR